MCCRYVLLQDHAKSLLEQIGALVEAGNLPPTRHNIPPGGRIPAVRNSLSTNASKPKCHLIGDTFSALELASLHWGLTPAWASASSAPLVNARAESLFEKPSFRDAARTRRCLVPASGFYEWKISGRSREPWLFRLRDRRPFWFAALWDASPAPDGTHRDTIAVVTTAPNAVMAPVHHRMPAIVSEPADTLAWLDPRITSSDTLSRLLRPAPDALLDAVAVNPAVNDIRHDAPDCLAPATVQQLGLAF